MIRRLAILASALAVTASAEDRWLQLRSRNFEVITNCGASAGRETLRRFEQIRRLFQTRTGRTDLSPLPVRIFVFRSEGDFRPYQIHAHTAGYYQPGPSRDYIAMQAAGDGGYRVVFHEYVHLVLRHAGVPVPVWFNEGTAELYSTVGFQGGETRIGDFIPAHLATLRSERMLDIPTLVAVDHRSAHYNERGKTGIFYAQSWALAHMLNFSPAYQPGVANFIHMILSGEPHQDAFRRAFGKAETSVLEDLRAYAGQQRFAGRRMKTAPIEDEDKQQPVRLAQTDVRLMLADLLLAIRRPEAAAQIYAELAKSNPHSAEVEAASAALALQAHRDEEAVGRFRKAIELGTKNGRVYYEYAMLLRERNAPEQEILANLEAAARLDPYFFDAFHLLGYLHLREKRFAPAIENLRRAASLQPSRATVWEYLALAYHYSGDRDRAKSAANNARRAASSPEEAARMEAVVEMVEKPPEPFVMNRPPDGVSNKPSPDGRDAALLLGRDGITLEGSLIQVDCLGDKARLHIASAGRRILLLVRNPASVTMRGTFAPGYEFACGPAVPRLVEVRYRSAADANYGTAGDVSVIELR